MQQKNCTLGLCLIWCRVVRSRDVQFRIFSRPTYKSSVKTWPTIVLTFLYPYHTHSPETGVINRLRFLASQPNNAATSPCKMKHNNAKKDKIEFRKATDKSVSAQCLSCLYSSSKG